MKEKILKQLNINNLILLTIVILCMWIGYNQTRISNKNKAIDNVNKIVSIIEAQDIPEYAIKYDIKDGIFLDNKEVLTKEDILGNGLVFYDKHGITVVVYDGKTCAIKLGYTDDVYVDYKKCVEFNMLMGIKFQVVKKGYGIYREGNEYIYRGVDMDNYLMYKSHLYKIVSFNKESITLRSVTDDNTYNILGEDDSEHLTKIYDRVIDGIGTKGEPYIVENKN